MIIVNSSDYPKFQDMLLVHDGIDHVTKIFMNTIIIVDMIIPNHGWTDGRTHCLYTCGQKDFLLMQQSKFKRYGAKRTKQMKFKQKMANICLFMT